ncbi:MAG: hypothetical protein R2939_23015 [Kofleriaceae bacterium]
MTRAPRRGWLALACLALGACGAAAAPTTVGHQASSPPPTPATPWALLPDGANVDDAVSEIDARDLGTEVELLLLEQARAHRRGIQTLAMLLVVRAVDDPPDQARVAVATGFFRLVDDADADPPGAVVAAVAPDDPEARRPASDGAPVPPARCSWSTSSRSITATTRSSSCATAPR